MLVEGVQKEQEKEQQKEKKKSKLVGWSTENMEDKQRNQEFKHSGEMVLWMSIDQEGIDKMWKTLSKIKRKKCQKSTKLRSATEEHTKEKVSRRSGGCFRESTKISTLEVGEDCWATIYVVVQEYGTSKG